MNQQKTLLARPVTVIAIAVFVCMGLHRGARTVADESGSWSGLFTRPFSGLTGGKSGSPTPATAQGDLVLAARRPPAPSESDPSPDSANTVESTLSLNPGFSGGINRQGAALAALQDAAGNQQSAIYPANSSNDPGIPHGVPQRGPTNGDAATARIHPTNSASIETTQRRGMELASSVVGATSPQHVPHSVAAAASGNTVVTHSLDPKTPAATCSACSMAFCTLSS
ncbi:MAG: hypothetical protein AAFN70_04630, partial [Planctomycetota bacterium]